MGDAADDAERRAMEEGEYEGDSFPQGGTMTETEEVVDGEATEIVEAPLPAVSPPTTESTALVARNEIDVSELVGQGLVIQEAMRLAMTSGIHYGRIPGVDKPTLLKPGAEKLLVLFRLAPAYESDKIWHDDGHLTVSAKCILHHIPTGLKVAEGEGLCTTRESRYAWRKGGRICPDCGKEAIIKGKAEYGGGWLCYAKKGGCGNKWDDGSEQAKEFEEANLDRVPNPDLPDQYNTVLKMADKRALVAAILNGTAASDVFTQDMEDATAGGSESGSETSSRILEREPAKQRPFDPDVDLLPGAIKGAGAARAISDALGRLAPHVDWTDTITMLVRDVYDVDEAKAIPSGKRSDWLRRLSNATAKLGELVPGDFPPATNEQVVEAFTFAFPGSSITISEKEGADAPAS